MAAPISTFLTGSEKLALFQQTMDAVYGEPPAKATEKWIPKPYDRTPRYLWTDAFGVCNYLSWYAKTKEVRYLDCAKALICNVHDTLGKMRDGSRRLPTATDEMPTSGGLRIGKQRPETEEDGDGQYFHYLTKWMFALNRMSIVTHDLTFNEMAVVMAKNVFPKFVQRDVKRHKYRMFWKMSIDLQKPVVFSEGNLDPFDGLVTYKILQTTLAQNRREGQKYDASYLDKEIGIFQEMVDAKYLHYTSNDPLDLGEALWLSHFQIEDQWAHTVAEVSLQQLECLFNKHDFGSSATYRLAFREFGTTLGLQSLLSVSARAQGEEEQASMPMSLAQKKIKWLERVEQIHMFWKGHVLFDRDKDITPIMFCTSLLPTSFLKGFEDVLP